MARRRSLKQLRAIFAALKRRKGGFKKGAKKFKKEITDNLPVNKGDALAVINEGAPLVGLGVGSALGVAGVRRLAKSRKKTTKKLKERNRKRKSRGF